MNRSRTEAAQTNEMPLWFAALKSLIGKKYLQAKNPGGA
jgi:hypothetical protein